MQKPLFVDFVTDSNFSAIQKAEGDAMLGVSARRLFVQHARNKCFFQHSVPKMMLQRSTPKLGVTHGSPMGVRILGWYLGAGFCFYSYGYVIWGCFYKPAILTVYKALCVRHHYFTILL